MIKTTIEITLKRFEVQIKRLIDDAALAVLSVIKTRTDVGIGYDGDFWNYSTNYAAWKRERGYSPGGRGDWLRLSGQLMGSTVANMKFKLLENDGRRGVIGFYGDHQPYGERFISRKTKKIRAKARKFNTPVKTRHGPEATEPLSNAQLGFYLNKKFRFFGISEPEKRRIIKNLKLHTTRK